ncbi:sugar kinase [Phaeovulum sp. W22_SRMD_FR3]|uniref:sugar kinase n=1 Tax=Phaeovulum sp. W22_SRMD_FR3 TaxID=3240274 RepID=UPI003F96C775
MRYLSIGEPLAEFTAQRETPSRFDRRAGGDTLNTAIYLARLSGAGQVGYLSCLGDDPQSQWLREAIAEEGIDTAALAERKGGRPGLSFISTDAQGERSFTYWRDQAPFRQHFDDPAALGALERADCLILSAVTLAVLHPTGRENLLGALERRRAQGAQVAFDTNYRPVLWPDAAAARDVMDRMAAIATMILPSLDDLAACYGTTSPQAALERLMAVSTAEIVLTTGGGDVLHRAAGSAQGERYKLPPAVAAHDTTGAGDSFNAGWLVARARGLSVAESITAAARLATVVVCHPGAIIPQDAMPVLFA